MDGECSIEYIDIPDSGRRNVEKKSKQKYFDSEDSTTEESIGHIEAYLTESGEQLETNDETAPKAISTGVKRKQIGSPVIDAERVMQNKISECTQSKKWTHGRMKKDVAVPILSTTELTFTLGQFKKGIWSKSTRKTASKAFEIQGRGGPRMSIPIPKPGMKINTVQKIRTILPSCILKW